MMTPPAQNMSRSGYLLGLQISGDLQNDGFEVSGSEEVTPSEDL